MVDVFCEFSLCLWLLRHVASGGLRLVNAARKETRFRLSCRSPQENISKKGTKPILEKE